MLPLKISRLPRCRAAQARRLYSNSRLAGIPEQSPVNPAPVQRMVPVAVPLIADVPVQVLPSPLGFAIEMVVVPENDVAVAVPLKVPVQPSPVALAARHVPVTVEPDCDSSASPITRPKLLVSIHPVHEPARLAGVVCEGAVGDESPPHAVTTSATASNSARVEERANDSIACPFMQRPNPRPVPA